jgi:hypothetical protein
MPPKAVPGSRHFRLRPPWPGAATRDENRWARPSSALLGAAEPVATRAIFVSVEGSLRGTSCRRENRAIPSQAGLFSDQDEAAGSSPARPTKPASDQRKCWSLRFPAPTQLDASRRDEVLRAIPVLSRNSASDQPLYGPTLVGAPQMIGFTTVSEPIPVSWTISSTKLRADPCWASPSRRSRRCRDARSVQLKAPRAAAPRLGRDAARGRGAAICRPPTGAPPSSMAIPLLLLTRDEMCTNRLRGTAHPLAR